jgi:hypothetical protein
MTVPGETLVKASGEGAGGGAFLIFVFNDCELDLDRYELRRAGRHRPVEPQVFDLLAFSRRFRLVRYDERGCGLLDWDVGR